MKKEKKVDKKTPFITISTILSLIFFLTLALVFFYMLDSKFGVGFGLREILSSAAISLLVTLFLVWIKSVLVNNLYLGIFISLIALAAFVSSLLTRFSGPNTTVFLIIFSLGFISYIIYSIVKRN